MFPRLCRRHNVLPCVDVQFKGLDSVLINKEGAWVPLLGRDRQGHPPEHLELCSGPGTGWRHGEAEGKAAVIQVWLSTSFLSLLGGII